jgi:hypothetical protein
MSISEQESEMKVVSEAEILSDICLQEAKQLYERMLKLQGKPPMSYSFITHNLRTLETPMFGAHLGVQDDNFVTYGWKASLFGEMPENTISSGKRLPDEAFIDFGKSQMIGLAKVGFNEDNQQVFYDQLGHIDVGRRLFLDTKVSDKTEVLEADAAAELRVILEYGLQALGAKPKNKIISRR